MIKIPVPTETVDMQTGKVTDRRTTDFNLMPPPPGVCQTCGRDHDPKLPHDVTRLYYQYQFFGQHKRWPTWKDALAHCSDEMKAGWEMALKERGAWTE